jgi:hypothetical protein
MARLVPFLRKEAAQKEAVEKEAAEKEAAENPMVWIIFSMSYFYF